MTTIVLTEQLMATPRILKARALVREEGSSAAGVFVSLGAARDPMAPFLRDGGDFVAGLGACGADSVEDAVEGALDRFDASRVLLFGSPRAVLALPRLRRSRQRPVIEAILPRLAADAWDEIGTTALRAFNLVDVFHTEEEAVAEALHALGIGYERLRLMRVTNPPDHDTAPPGGEETGRTWIVHSASDRARPYAAQRLASEWRERGCAAYSLPFEQLITGVMRDSREDGGRVLFVEPLDSLEFLNSEVALGWPVFLLNESAMGAGGRECA